MGNSRVDPVAAQDEHAVGQKRLHQRRWENAWRTSVIGVAGAEVPLQEVLVRQDLQDYHMLVHIWLAQATLPQAVQSHGQMSDMDLAEPTLVGPREVHTRLARNEQLLLQHLVDVWLPSVANRNDRHLLQIGLRPGAQHSDGLHVDEDFRHLGPEHDVLGVPQELPELMRDVPDDCAAAGAAVLGACNGIRWLDGLDLHARVLSRPGHEEESPER
mmetsp:Transcript_106655/g.340343  ORF Transcript_106655/g.340343 Transcript_106655/m.340343 type:complete len:215 (-) Transcript_106655:3563-4207(-)